MADHIAGLDAGKHVLDIGSGSGLLSLMIAQQTGASIESIEIQKTDYLQSLDNIANSPYRNQITIHQSDALQFKYNRKYDIILSNPPFYENDLKGSLAGKNIAHHDDGLKLQDLLNLITQQLTRGGSFYLLLPFKRLADLQQAIAITGLFINETASVHQTESHDAFRVMLRVSFSENKIADSKVVIKESGAYSQAFTRLLKDYYLYL